MDVSAPIDWPGGSWEATVGWFAIAILICLTIAWTLSLVWTFNDIRQRTSNKLLQGLALLCVAILFVPGLWIYRTLRPRYYINERFERRLIEEALVRELEETPACPSCKRRIREDFLFCPACFAVLQERCERCRRPVALRWAMCPYCGVQRDVAAAASTGPLVSDTASAPVPLALPDVPAARLSGQRGGVPGANEESVPADATAAS
jgi:predicted RNA-binding Zn-ribbon protein involved in translation (DUF1610 family)